MFGQPEDEILAAIFRRWLLTECCHLLILRLSSKSEVSMTSRATLTWLSGSIGFAAHKSNFGDVMQSYVAQIELHRVEDMISLISDRAESQISTHTDTHGWAVGFIVIARNRFAACNVSDRWLDEF
eukprot:3256593-Amphidinium_carterae.1